MASSDNVLRAGLTSKRVNVPELLRVLDFTPAEPEVLRAQLQPDGIEAVYRTPVDDFRLSRLELHSERATLPAGRPKILLCIGRRSRVPGRRRDRPGVAARPVGLHPGQRQRSEYRRQSDRPPSDNGNLTLPRPS